MNVSEGTSILVICPADDAAVADAKDWVAERAFSPIDVKIAVRENCVNVIARRTLTIPDVIYPTSKTERPA